jgi:hypothetical protein
LITFDDRKDVALLDAIADPLAHVANDAGETGRDLNQRFLVRLDHAVQQQAVMQHAG